MIHTAFATRRRSGFADFSVDPVAAFTDHLAGLGLIPAREGIIADDTWRRCDAGQAPGDRDDGSYILAVADTGFAYGFGQNHKTGEGAPWNSRGPGYQPSPEERALMAQQRERAREQSARRQKDDLARSMQVWDRADMWVCAEHPYIAKKRMQVQGDWRADGDVLLIPAYDRSGAVVAYERIFPNGDKRGCKGFGKDVNAFYRFEGHRDAVAVCEGVATAWAVREALGWTVYVARSAGNLKAAVAHARARHPDAVAVVVAGDNDDNGTGQKAAEGAGGDWFRCPDQPGDWWDVWDNDGADAVKRALISGALISEPIRRQPHSLVLDEKGRPIWNAANALTVLSSHPDWTGVFCFNELSGRRVVLRPMPDSDVTNVPRDLVDDDYTAVRAWFNRNGYPRATGEITCESVRAVAGQNRFDPLTEYLDGLQWDGKSRIDSWLVQYLGAADAATVRAYGRKWLISAVARAYKPGCKADYMLVLEGEQGLRKSSVVRALCGEDWFSDNLPPMGTKDASEHLAGRWVVEVAELDSMSKAGIESAKAFITRQVESFRPAYGREVLNQPRRCVFVGTTNRDNWLNDSSGGRRFWPVRVGHIDIEAVTRDRDQIWAEAVAAYRAGEAWWLDDETEALARQDQAERRNSDPWEPDIAGYISGKAQVSISDILRDCLFIPRERQDRKMSNRVAAVLQALNWRRDGQFTSGPMKGQAKYVPVH